MRLKAQEQCTKAKTGPEGRTNCANFIHRVYYTSKNRRCKPFFQS